MLVVVVVINLSCIVYHWGKKKFLNLWFVLRQGQELLEKTILNNLHQLL